MNSKQPFYREQWREYFIEHGAADLLKAPAQPNGQNDDAAQKVTVYCENCGHGHSVPEMVCLDRAFTYRCVPCENKWRAYIRGEKGATAVAGGLPLLPRINGQD